MARLVEVEHRARAGGGGRGGRDQDGAGAAARALPQTLHAERADARRWTGRRGRSSCCERHRVAARRGRARAGGVSSFGISGTNAHVVLEEAPARRGSAGATTARRPRTERPRGCRCWCRGRDEAALRAQAERYADVAVDASGSRLGCCGGHGGVASDALLRPGPAVWRGDAAEACGSAARAVARRRAACGGVAGRARTSGGRVVFVFPGPGSAVGRRWAERCWRSRRCSPSAMAACDAALWPARAGR